MSCKNPANSADVGAIRGATDASTSAVKSQCLLLISLLPQYCSNRSGSIYIAMYRLIEHCLKSRRGLPGGVAGAEHFNYGFIEGHNFVRICLELTGSHPSSSPRLWLPSTGRASLYHASTPTRPPINHNHPVALLADSACQLAGLKVKATQVPWPRSPCQWPRLICTKVQGHFT